MGYKPLTVIKIIQNAPCDDTYSDVIKFGSAGEQAAYFSGLAVRTCNNCSYQRVSNSVRGGRPAYTCRVPFVADELYNCNYIMFQNSTFGSKWFYAFIRQINYISPANTEIVYEIDYYQTYQFNYKVKESFVEREHPVDDKKFSNTQPEPFVTSFALVNNESEYNFGTDYHAVVWALTDSLGNFQEGDYRSNIFTTVKGSASGTAFATSEYIQQFFTHNQENKIVSVQNVPFIGGHVSGGIPEANSESEIEIELPSSISGYSPKYNKCFSFPYCYLKVTDQCSNSKIYSYEKFQRQIGITEEETGAIKIDVLNRSPKFKITTKYTYPPAIRVAPIGYEVLTDTLNVPESFVISSFSSSPVAGNATVEVIKNLLDIGIPIIARAITGGAF